MAPDAFKMARRLHDRGVGASVDQFGEQTLDDAGAKRVAAEYLRLADGLGDLPKDAWLSIDLSHLGLDVDLLGCTEHLAAIAGRLSAGRRIQIGAEDHERADAVLESVLTVASLADRLGATVQANLRRAPDDLERLIAAGVHIRPVKGAYVESAARALPYGEATDVAYLHLAHRLAEADARFALGTHDGVLREALLAALGPRPVEQPSRRPALDIGRSRRAWRARARVPALRRRLVPTLDAPPRRIPGQLTATCSLIDRLATPAR